jgi:hypothetical protein
MRKKIAAICTASLLCAPSFASIFDFASPSWTTEERAGLCHYMQSQKLVNEAIASMNVSEDFQLIPTHIIAAARSNYRAALDEANAVPQSMLEKMHTDMPKRYQDFKTSLRLRIQSLSGSRSVQDAVTAHQLFNDFSTWFTRNKSSFKIPKGAVASCR